MSDTSPNTTIWTPDFFWEAPPTSRQHIDEFNSLNAVERYDAAFLEGEYFAEVRETTASQSPELIRTFAEFVMAKVAAEGVLVIPANPVSYVTFRRAQYKGQAENGQNLVTIAERWLRPPVGEDKKIGEDLLLTFEQQQARDLKQFNRTGYALEDLAKIKVFTDSRAIYEWPKMPTLELVRDWPMVEMKVRTSGLHLGVTYPDYQRGLPLPLPTTPERVEAIQTFLAQLPLTDTVRESDSD